MKNIILHSLLCLLFANTGHAIVDTLYSEPAVDGGIDHYGYNNSLQASTAATYFMPGDGVDLIHGGENYAREYLSFDLTTLPESSNINNALLMVYQYESRGNDSLGVFPHWTGYPGGDTMSCIIDHIDYGSTLDTLDWTSGDVGDPQTITSSYGVISITPDTCWKTLDVTSCLQADVITKRSRSQYRMRFKIGSDYDGRGDRLYMLSGNSVTNKPMLIINYTTGVEGTPYCVIDIEDTKLEKNAPNPFLLTTDINYQLKSGGKINFVIYDLQGREIAELVNKYQQPGTYTITWDGKDKSGSSLPNGIYFYRLTCGSTALVQKMVLLK